MQRRVGGAMIAVRAVIWSAFAIIWIMLTLTRIAHLRAAGRPVDWRSWTLLWFWVAVLLFWAVVWLRSWRIRRRRNPGQDGKVV